MIEGVRDRIMKIRTYHGMYTRVHDKRGRHDGDLRLLSTVVGPPLACTPVYPLLSSCSRVCAVFVPKNGEECGRKTRNEIKLSATTNSCSILCLHLEDQLKYVYV